MARRPVALVGALVLLLEAVGMMLIHIFLSMVVDDQQMSLAGLEPRSMTVGTVVGGVVFGGYLVLCAAVLLHMAVRDRPPRHFPRVLLISAAVVHGLLGAFSISLVGWVAFLCMMLVLGLVVWSLVTYGERSEAAGRLGPAGESASGTGAISSKPTGP